MKQSILILICAFSITVHSQSYIPVDEGSRIAFTIRNFGISVTGTFNGLKGMIRFDPASPGSAIFNVTVEAKTIDTDNKSRNNHLKKEEYFWIDKYPQLSFVSSKISSSEAGNFLMHGILTIKGVSKEIAFPFTAKQKTGGYLFEGTFTIDRRDFKVGGGSMVLSDNLNVSLSVFAKKG